MELVEFVVHHLEQLNRIETKLDTLIQRGETTLATVQEVQDNLKIVKDGLAALGTSLTAEAQRASASFDALRKLITGGGTITGAELDPVVADLATMSANLQGLKAKLDQFDVASTVVSPATLALTNGQTVQLGAKDVDGTDVTATCQFVSDNPAVASVTSGGLVAWVGVGSCNVTVTPANGPAATVAVVCS